MNDSIKVLIVDDEKLVRKGMISIMPWAEHGFEVVGDVNSGEKALEFLAQDNVDLLITDLAMPMMSGIELIQTVKELYPRIFAVVLTFHQDFAYIQDALRLGAIDYILKTQLEKEQMGDVLGRIAARIRDDINKSGGGAVGKSDRNIFMKNNGLMLVGNRREMAAQLLRKTPHLNDEFRVFCLDGGAIVLDGVDGDDEMGSAAAKIQALFPECIVVRLLRTKGHDNEVLAQLLKSYLNDLYYEFNGYEKIYVYAIPDAGRPATLLPDAEGAGAEDEGAGSGADEVTRAGAGFDVGAGAGAGAGVQALREGWSALRWVYDDSIYNLLLQQIFTIRPSPEKLESIFYTAAREWEHVLALLSLDINIEPPSNQQYWYDWKQWISGVRGLLREKTQKPAYSREIVKSIMNALDIINNNKDANIKQENVARMVNMSRSYFSKSFRDITGASFNDYVRNVKISKAKLLLEQTDKPIYWISVQIGYLNEKHFSRVFHEITGMLPTEYRNKYRKSIWL